MKRWFERSRAVPLFAILILAVVLVIFSPVVSGKITPGVDGAPDCGARRATMITDPDPTLVMPTSRPPSMPTSRVGIGRIGGLSSGSTPPLRTRPRLM